MYSLYAIDTVLRITAALLVLFVAVPALAWPRPASFSRLEWFWWNLGVGLTVLTLDGQLFTLLNIASTVSYLLLFAAIIAICRARRAGLPALRWIRDTYRNAVLFALHVLDGRTSIRRRIARRIRRARLLARKTLAEHRGGVLAWRRSSRRRR